MSDPDPESIVNKSWSTTIGPQQVDIATGSSIELSAQRPRLLDINRTGLTREADLSVLNGLALQLMAFVDDECHPWGSGILAAPGVGITARHVYDEFKSLGVGSEEGASLSALSVHEGRAVAWSVTQVLSIGGTDLALLVLDCRTPWKEKLGLSLPEIHLCLPRVGDSVFAYGFRASEKTFPRNSGKTSVGMIGLSSCGKVTAVYPSGRDSAILPGPCIETSITTVGGMSGGPVFDSSGRVIGLISSSFHWGPDDGVTFISLLWTAAFRKITPVWPPAMYSQPMSLKEISEAKDMHCFLSYSSQMRWEDDKLKLHLDD